MKRVFILLVVITLLITGCAPKIDLTDPNAIESLECVDAVISRVLHYFRDDSIDKTASMYLSKDALKVIGESEYYADRLLELSEELKNQKHGDEEYKELVFLSIDVLKSEVDLVIINFELFSRTGDQNEYDDLASIMAELSNSRNTLARLIGEPALIVD